MYPNETRPDLHLKPHDKIVDTYTPSTNININTSQARSMHQRKKGEEEGNEKNGEGKKRASQFSYPLPFIFSGCWFPSCG